MCKSSLGGGGGSGSIGEIGIEIGIGTVSNGQWL